MKHKLLIPLRLLLVAICMLGIAAEGQNVVQDDFNYQIDLTTQTATCMGYDGSSETPIMPAYVTYENQQYPVTATGEMAFRGNSSITKITLPETLKIIGHESFEDCSALTSIDIPGSVERIDHWAFRYDNALTEVILHDGLKYIGEYSFSDCGNIEELIIPNTVDTICQAAFANCHSLKRCKLSDNLTVIPGGIFANCESLESIEIPNSVTRFTENWYFYSWDEQEILTIGPEDFGFAEDFGWYWVAGSAFLGCTSLKNVFLPANLQCIPEATFVGCKSLTNIEIPPTINRFGSEAFSQVPLKYFDLPELEYWPASIFANNVPCEQYIKSYCTNPMPFYPFIVSSISLYVPKGLSGIYRNVPPWNESEHIVEATPVELESEWRTFCAVEDLDFSGVEGLEAYIATEYQDGKVLMEPIEQVPAGTGVVLKGAPGFYEIPYAEQLEPVDNLLVGLNYGERVAAETEEGNCNLFFNDATEMASLFYGPFMDSERAPRLNAEGEQPMFAPADGARLPYHRAYLQLPASEAGKTVEMVFGTLTGIEEVEAQPQTDGTIYNLQGQRVVNPGPGIYIQNGRKFVVR